MNNKGFCHLITFQTYDWVIVPTSSPSFTHDDSLLELCAPLYFKGALATLWFWPLRNANVRSCQSSTHASQFPNANGLDSCPVMVSFRLPFHRGLVSWQFSLFRSFLTEGKKEEKTLTHLSLSWPDTHLVDSKPTIHFRCFYCNGIGCFVTIFILIKSLLNLMVKFGTFQYVFGSAHFSWRCNLHTIWNDVMIFRPIWIFKCVASIRY